jgi:hypothetical protein
MILLFSRVAGASRAARLHANSCPMVAAARNSHSKVAVSEQDLLEQIDDLIARGFPVLECRCVVAEYVVTIEVDGESYHRAHTTRDAANREREWLLGREYSTKVTIAIRGKTCGAEWREGDGELARCDLEEGHTPAVHRFRNVLP